VLNHRDLPDPSHRPDTGATRSLRVLALSYETPAYPAAGGPSRQSALLEPLAQRHRIRVLSTGGPPVFGSMPEGVEIRLIDPGPPASLPNESWFRRNARHYFVGGPWLYVLALHHVRALSAALHEEIRSFEPDLVVVEHEELAPLLDRVPRGVPTALVLHNVLLEVQWQNRRRRQAWGSFKAWMELFVLAREERRALKKATVTVVVSELSAQLAHALRRSAHTALIPNCVNTSYFRREGPRAGRPVIVMTASYHYPPNQVGAREMLERVFPTVRAQIPDAELRLVGQQMPPWLEALAKSTSGARAVGAVNDVRPHLQDAWVAVAPLRLGSGSPLKVLEALSMEVPVVATPRVQKSLGLSAAEGLTTADRPDDLARAIAGLLSEPDRIARLGEAGRAAVAQRFDNRRLALDLERAWIEVTERNPGRP